MSDDHEPPIRVGISKCLLGEAVRYDGGHKHDPYITETLGRYFEWVGVCPEVELGLGTPRETIHLIDHGAGIRLQATQTGVDLTHPMRTYAATRVAALQRDGISGYILKKDSPSCGLAEVRVHPPGGPARRIGRGLFAEVLLETMPHLPVIEEDRLTDPARREHWIRRVVAYRDLRQLWRPRWTVSDLIAFHARYRFTLLAHSQQHCRQLDRLLAQARSMPCTVLSRADVRRQYTDGLLTALETIATPAAPADVQRRMREFFDENLEAAAAARMTVSSRNVTLPLAGGFR